MNTWSELMANMTQYRLLLFSIRPAYWFAGVSAMAGHYWSQGPELWRVLGVLAPGLFLLDLFTGIAKSALVEHRPICSEALGRSLVKAYVYLSLFLLCVALDWSARTGYSGQLALLIFVSAREGKSNLENLSALRGISGIEIPGFIGRGFEKLAGREEGKSDEDRS